VVGLAENIRPSTGSGGVHTVGNGQLYSSSAVHKSNSSNSVQGRSAVGVLKSSARTTPVSSRMSPGVVKKNDRLWMVCRF
jgi:hypothetical protein